MDEESDIIFKIKNMEKFAVKDGDYGNSKGKDCIVTIGSEMGTLELLKELEKKATPGPWHWSAAHGVGFLYGEQSSEAIGCAIDYLGVQDIQFITTMRNTLPKLLALVEAGDALAESIAIRRRNELFGDTCDLGQALIKYRKQRLEFEEK